MQATFAVPEAALREQATADGITHFSTGVAILHAGKVLIVRRAPDDYLGGYYELPGGGVDDGESLETSVAREAREETGLEVAEILGMFPGFDYTTPKKPHVRQFNFLVRTKSADLKLSSEHDAFQWISLEDVDNLLLSDSMKKCLIDALELAASFTEDH